MFIDAMQNNLWSMIYPKIREEFIAADGYSISRSELERYLIELNIHVIKDPADGRWQQIKLPDGCELTMLLLKYGQKGQDQ